MLKITLEVYTHMASIKFNKKDGIKLGGKLFYAALALCLIATGVAGWVAVRNTSRLLSGDTSSYYLPQNSNTSNSDDTQHTNNTVSGIKASSSKAPTSSQATASKSKASSAVKNADKDVFYMLPVSGEIINMYSKDTLVFSQTFADWRVHDAVDFSGRIGTPVKAVSDGTVIDVVKDALWGTTVTIDHGNNLKSIYCSLGDNPTVDKGDTVEAGFVIGSIGKSCSAEVLAEPHLHFIMTKNDKNIDPFEIISK
jgi:murein DD-endopeptidase MepM/ murein hydrolase activator NlpD